MAINMQVTNFALIATSVFVVYTAGVDGGSPTFCPSSWSSKVTVCDEAEFCCGLRNDNCCENPLNPGEGMEVISLLIIVFFFICCPILCYRCCCRRTTNRGVIYSQAPGTMTTVSVSLPPQQMAQVPYPTVVPYPQQTPYPPQYATNPYFGMPPPAYGEAVNAGTQQASAPPSAMYPS